MKKAIIALAIIAVSTLAQAQGTVNWTGVAGNFIATTNYLGNSGFTSLSVGGVYYYELLTSSGLSAPPTTLSMFGNNLATSWVDTGLSMTNGATANGRAVQINPVSNATANNWAVGATQNIIVVGWSASVGTTWSQALANLSNWGNNSLDNVFGPVYGYFGVGQSVGTLTIAGANPGISIFGANPGQINDTGANALVMNALLLPEPTTIALAGLGGVALLALRRKK